MRRPATLLALMVLACGDPPAGQGTLFLGWTFADGRRCAESGVEWIVLTRLEQQAVLAESDCPSGFGAPTLEVSLPVGNQELQLSGLSGSATPLYRRTFHMALTPGISVDRVVELAFVGGL